MIRLNPQEGSCNDDGFLTMKNEERNQGPQ